MEIILKRIQHARVACDAGLSSTCLPTHFPLPVASTAG